MDLVTIFRLFAPRFSLGWSAWEARMDCLDVGGDKTRGDLLFV